MKPSLATNSLLSLGEVQIPIPCFHLPSVWTTNWLCLVIRLLLTLLLVGCVCTGKYRYVYAHERQSWCGASSIFLHLIFWVRIFQWAWPSPIHFDWKVSQPQRLSFFCSPTLPSQVRTTVSTFTQCWDLDSVLHTHSQALYRLSHLLSPCLPS